MFPASAGHYYLGPCRCGFGPHAFYRTSDGRIVRASQLFHPIAGPAAIFPPMKPEEEAKLLEEEAKALREELSRVEERLKELKK